jgi:hypothetical protein
VGFLDQEPDESIKNLGVSLTSQYAWMEAPRGFSSLRYQSLPNFLMLSLADAGANRVTIWLDQTAGDAALTEMDQIARQVLV